MDTKLEGGQSVNIIVPWDIPALESGEEITIQIPFTPEVDDFN